jgi:cysteine-rich repeat protein
VHTPVNSLCDDHSTCTDDVCTVTSGCVYSAHVFFCGNGVKEDPTACGSCGSPAEQCDGGDLGGATCPTPTYHGGTPICRADCTLDFDTTVGTQGGCWRCGNGRIEPGETCDGGNLNGTPGYGCPTNCATLCGDHVVQSNEQCDDGNRTDGDGCSSQCKLEYQYEGGGGEAKDCNLEWGVLGATPGATVTCADGSMACDQDGTINSSCRFAVSYCFNVYPGRPGAPACMPSNLATYQLWGASLSGSAMLDAATQTAVLDKLRSTLVLVLGTTVTASGPVRTVSPALLDLNLCGSLMLDVPLGQSRALAVQTNDSANVVDQDVMTFSCTQ